MGRNDWNTVLSWLIKEFIEKFSEEHINKQDIFGRTALHYAGIGCDRRFALMLKQKNADETIQDNYRKTSEEYAKIREDFGSSDSLLQLKKSFVFIARHYREISACIRSCFVDNSPTVKECKAKMLETVQELTGYCDKTSYVLNIWHGCRYDYRDVTSRKPVALQRDDQRLCQREDIAADNEGSDTKPMSMSEAIRSHVSNAMEELAKAITNLDHRFACEIFPVGSARGGTKIGFSDEFDFNFVLTNLSSICKVSYSPESPPGFVLLKASAPVHDEGMKNLFDENGILNTRIIKFKFEILVKQVLSSAAFCDLTGFEMIDPVSVRHLGLKSGNVSAKINTCIHLTFTKPVNNCHVPHSVSIDVVPALHIDDWWPDDARKTELCRAGECLIYFTQPQIKYPWIGWVEPHGFISFAKADSRLLRDCHPVIRAAYMVVKRMSGYFCQYKFFASHTIKTALLWCLDEEDLMKYRSSQLVKKDTLYTRIHDTTHSDEVRGDELLCLVQKILRRLLCFAAQDYIPSYFLPKCHQPVWFAERYPKQYHMRMYQHGLT